MDSFFFYLIIIFDSIEYHESGPINYFYVFSIALFLIFVLPPPAQPYDFATDTDGECSDTDGEYSDTDGECSDAAAE